MADLTLARQGRLNKALNKRFTFDDGVFTLSQRIRRFAWHRKDTYVQHYASRERCLEHPKLSRPKTWYSLWRWDDEKETGLTVPKIVWDSLADVPEAEFTAYEAPVTGPPYDPLKMDTVCPACGGPTDWAQDAFPTGPHRLICLDDMEHTPAHLDLFKNLGPEPKGMPAVIKSA